ncbi:hypothetical protein BGX31_001530 [Mortierella sp. GBA43]|nr:hypothetical protein BGX31_001530 [Mortierella sp. GBA43]
MDTFVDWITDEGNFCRTQQRLEHSHEDIAIYINSKRGTKWDRITVKNAIRFVKKRYHLAMEILRSTGKRGNTDADTALREQVLIVCPPFERLDTVFGTPCERLQLPPAQTLTSQPTEDETAHSQRNNRRKAEKTAVATSFKDGVMTRRASKEEDVVVKLSFISKGMDTLVDWVTDTGNYKPSTLKRTRFYKKRLVHTYGDIAKHINSIHGTKWNRDTLNNALCFLRSSYDRAKKILESTRGNIEKDATLRDKVLTVCPPFEKLQTVFEPPLKRPHLQPGEPADSDDTIDMGYDDHPTEDETTPHSSRGSKRRKTEKTDVATFQDRVIQTMQASDRWSIAMDGVMADIRRRQEVLEAREKDLTDRLLETEKKHHEMLMRKEEQRWEMVVRMEEQHRERLKKRERDHRKSLEKRERHHRESLKKRERDHWELLKNRERDHWDMLKKREEEQRVYQQKQLKRRPRELEDEKAELDGTLQDTAADEGARAQNYTM